MDPDTDPKAGAPADPADAPTPTDDPNHNENAADDDDAALAAGFNHVTKGDAIPAEILADKQDTTPDSDDPADKGDTAAAVAPDTQAAPDGKGGDAEPAPPAFTDEQRAFISSLIDERDQQFQTELRKLNGRYGDLNARLEKAAKGGPLPAISAETFKHLREDGYEDLADLLARDLGGVFPGETPADKAGSTTAPAPSGADDDPGDGGTPAGTPAAEPTVTPTDDEAARTAASEAFANEYLQEHVPDWETKVQSDAFTTFLTTLPPAEADRLANSFNPFDVRTAIERFDAWEAERRQVQQDKEQRLAGAEPATSPAKGGGGPLEPTEEEALAAGFQRVRGGQAA